MLCLILLIRLPAEHDSQAINSQKTQGISYEHAQGSCFLIERGLETERRLFLL